MNQHLQNILNIIQQSDSLSAVEKANILQSLNDVDKELVIAAFKLDRTEKVKRTTAILLEETIEELEQKRKAIEVQNRKLEIEASLERVRSRTMAMQHSSELPEAANLLFRQVQALGMPAWSAGYCLWDDDKQAITLNMSSEGIMQPAFRAPLTEDPSFIHMGEAFERGESFYVEAVGGEELVKHYEYMRTLPVVGEILDSIIAAGHPLPTFQIFHLAYFTKGFLLFITYEAVPEAHDIFRQFAKVFDQTYTRFLDLQKAEAQAREAQIELSLERVRARAMAMQNSEELNELIGTVFSELTRLNLTPNRCVIMIYDPKTLDARWWMANSEAPDAPMNYLVKHHEHPPTLAYLKAWQERTIKFEYILEGTIKTEWDEFLFTETELALLPDFVIAGMKAADRAYLNASFNNFGSLTLASLQPLSGEQFDILLRFAKVFDLTYTRFNDLKQAEALAREARIEAALERVRGRTMAMHKSDELLDIISIVSEQLELLNFKFDNVSFGHTQDNGIKFWMSIKAISQTVICHVPYLDSPVLNRVEEAQMQGPGYAFSDVLTHEENQQWFDHLFNNADVDFPEEMKNFLLSCPGYSRTTIILRDIFFFAGNYAGTLYSTEENAIFRRFANVFDQTYTRFLDLQKAETQAREAKIEASLERVRSKAMSMHSSEDLTATIAHFYSELESFSITPRRCGVGLLNKETRIAELLTMNTTEQGNSMQLIGTIKMEGHPVLQGVYDHWLLNKEYHPVLRGEELKNYYQLLRPQIDFPDYPEGVVQYGYFFFFPEGGVYAWTDKELGENELKIYRRFTSVLSLTYRRYQDLKEAEAQTREAQIEVALERIRSKALAMQTSDDLVDVAIILREQMGFLGQPDLESSIVHLYNGDSETFEAWYAYRPPNVTSGKTIMGEVTVSKNSTAWAREAIANYESRATEYTIVSRGEKISEWYKELENLAPATLDYDKDGHLVVPEVLYYHFSKFAGGALLMISNQEPSLEARELQKRAAAVFGLAYTRFLDLQKAEANGREAVRRASLDRVRAEIASMRTTADLERITPLVWTELRILGVPFTRCGVFIMDEQQEEIHTFLSAPDGKAIAAFHLSYKSPGRAAQVLVHWRKKEMYKEHWDQATFIEWTRDLVEQGVIASQEKYLTEQHPSNLHLHFLPFLQGMLYVGSESLLRNEEIQLVQSLADAFSTAYARYEDFNKLESAKQQVENTLLDLKQAQAQLIQSEKMASLGELTAGIAHEIQNPLNFVNNFSEVNRELLTEMKAEMEKGNVDEVRSLADDIILNEEKINHHGKRADAIVKGMLQHSRMSSAVKEATDINNLAEEYLRLAYHGLRAKDNSFNASIKTHFDKSITNLAVIPQDIGRALLNLYNNAFYAVKEKKKQLNNGYEPAVSVSTEKVGVKVLIAVKDNGNGISEKVVDKIFQPFFTTKPTGQGTGLGLSLAYDIIKAHGGELKVETKEDEGTAFIISLPLLKTT